MELVDYRGLIIGDSTVERSEPVAARREPWWERTFRFCRQRPVLAGWLGFGLAENLALLVVVGGSSFGPTEW